MRGVARDSRRRRNDRRATIVGVVVERGQAAEHASGLARQREIAMPLPDEARGRRRISSSASIEYGNRPVSSIRRQQRGAPRTDRESARTPPIDAATRAVRARRRRARARRSRPRRAHRCSASIAAREARVDRAAAASAIRRRDGHAPLQASRPDRRRPPPAARRRRSRRASTNSSSHAARSGTATRRRSRAAPPRARGRALREVVAIGPRVQPQEELNRVVDRRRCRATAHPDAILDVNQLERRGCVRRSSLGVKPRAPPFDASRSGRCSQELQL